MRAWRCRRRARSTSDDPWGNHVQVVDYRDIQFTKTPEVLRAMNLDGLQKTEAAQREIRDRGLGG